MLTAGVRDQGAGIREQPEIGWPPVKDCPGCADPKRLGKKYVGYPQKAAVEDEARRMAACNGCEHLFRDKTGWLICAINQRQVELTVKVEHARCPKGKWFK